jgi:signal transduction histidine kinase
MHTAVKARSAPTPETMFPRRLLVAEDNAGDLRLLTETLSEANSGAELVVEHTLAGSLGRGETGDIDLMLLDLGLPDSTGLATLRAAVKHLPDMPIVVMTGSTDERLGQQALHEGAQDYLVKSDWMATEHGGRDLVRSIRNALERHRILQQLREANRLRSMFIATTSHELRTPLTIIRDYAQLLRDPAVGSLGSLQEECVEAILRNCSRLGDLVNDVLDVSKMESGSIALRIERVPPRELLRQCFDDFALECEAAGQRLILDAQTDLPLVQCDRGRITQVIVNLLANAHRFTPHGGTITLRATADADALQIVVSDTGIGIPVEAQHAIFDAFVQVGRPNGPGSQGTGLGLYIAKRIVTMHGGAIDVSSLPGKGCEFSITLPIEQRCEGLTALRAYLAGQASLSCGGLNTSLVTIWISPPLGRARRFDLLRAVERTAHALFRRQDAAFVSPVDYVIACVVQGGEQDACGFLRRLAAALGDEVEEFTVALVPVDRAAPERGADLPSRDSFEPIASHRRVN